MSDAPYPWLASAWHTLVTSQADNRLSHALLISGVPGLGRQALAHALAARLLCQHGTSCGDCAPCHWLRADNHPDLHRVEPLEDKRIISVDQVRDLISKLTLTSLGAGRKVAIVYPAETLNENAANCLLKTLEEPLGDSVIILVADQRVALPATIISRCLKIGVRIPGPDAALDWLQDHSADKNWPLLLRLAGGVPLAAVAMREEDFLAQSRVLGHDLDSLLAGRLDPAGAAERWIKIGPERSLDWLADVLCDVIRVKFGLAEPDLAHSLAIEGLPQHLNQIKLNGLFRYLDDVRVGRRRLETPLNRQSIIETLLVPWAARFALPN